MSGNLKPTGCTAYDLHGLTGLGTGTFVTAMQLSLFGPEVLVAPVKIAPRVTVSVCVLGSGSGGNSTVIRSGERAMLVDAGFGPLTISRRLRDAGMSLADIQAICLTHLDHDHFRPTWLATLRRAGIPLFVHRWHIDDLFDFHGDAARALHRAGLVHEFDGQPFEPVVGFRVASFRLQHDEKGTCGFVIETAGRRIGYATDLGHVPTKLIEHFQGVDLLALESNYDPVMQIASSRPPALKRRIMGQGGHLSNEQAFAAVRRILDASPPGSPRHVVLLHRSAQCNCPERVRGFFSRDERIAARLTLAEQRCGTAWLHL